VSDCPTRHPACPILSIEAPIEYLPRDKRAAVCQREIGLAAPPYHYALRAALRQDPDVILIGEVRDEESAMTALRAAETGQLVLCTMHTVNAPETVQRFIDLFGDRHVSLARQVMASTLVGISCQRLLPKVGGGRILNSEVMVNSARMRTLIGEGSSQSELEHALAEGEYYGMHTFDQDLMEKVRSGLVTMDDALAYASNAHDFKLGFDHTPGKTDQTLASGGYGNGAAAGDGTTQTIV